MLSASRFINEIFISVLIIGLMACGRLDNQSAAISIGDDESASGSVAGAIGAALSASLEDGTQANAGANTDPSQARKSWHTIVGGAFNFLPSAFAAALCPTYQTVGAECTAAGATLWLSYNACQMLGLGIATWSGTQALVKSAGSAQCGEFPHPGASGNLIRQFVTGPQTTTPGKLSIDNWRTRSLVIDHASEDLANFNHDVIAPLLNDGYGLQVNFNANGLRESLALKHRAYVIGRFDHSVNGSLAIQEPAPNGDRTVNGSIVVYHNLMRVIGTSTVSGLVHTRTCCLPVSGSISTNSSPPYRATKSESLTDRTIT